MTMKKITFLIITMLLPLIAMADAVEVDGIYYNLIAKGNAAEVTKSPSKYSGSVTIPSTISSGGVDYNVMVIGDEAFAGCLNLTSITMPNSITSIGFEAFASCTSLTSITIPNSVTSISNDAFISCTSLTSINIPNSVTSIPQRAFAACTSLSSITIPNSVTKIGEAAFSDCTSLTSITIPNSVTRIDKEAFQNCVSISSITIPNSVTSLGGYVFEDCSGLISVSIPNSVTSIGWYVFSGCTSLTSIIIPNSVTSLEQGAFQNCKSLSSITLSNSITSIGTNTFSGCTSLTSIIIPNSVTSIGNNALLNCTMLNSVTISNNITSIGEWAFAGCSQLTDVYCLAENVPYTYTNAFDNSYINFVTLHVPETSVAAYSNAEPWKNFKSIVGIDDGGTTQKCEKPSISYQNGKLTFSSETDGADFAYTINDDDVKQGNGAEVQLTATYTITVYAQKAGYINSDVATATLCWIDQEPTKEGIVDGIVNVPSRAIMISSEGGLLTINGAEDGTLIEVYKLDGTQAGASESKNGSARIYTNLQPGNIAIVKTDKKSFKVVIR